MLEEAARRFGAQLDIRWHAYELRPAPIPLPDPDGEYIAGHWQQRVLPMASERGLTMRLPRRQVRSALALQAALFARPRGRFPELDRAIFRARFEDDADIADIEVLKDLARGPGLDVDALGDALATGRYAAELRADVTLAYQIGIRGVPALLVGPEREDDDLAAFLAEAEPVIGAVPYEWLAVAIQRAVAGAPARVCLRGQ